MADAVRLEITVDDKGSPVIKAVTDNLDKLAKQSAKTSDSQQALNKTAQSAVEVFGNFGVQIGGVVGQIAGSLGPIGLLAGTIGTGLVAATTHAVNQFQKFAFQVRDLSYLSGGSAEDVAGLITAMEDLGVESGTVELGINKMSQAVANGDPMLKRLVGGFRTASGASKDALTLFYETVDALGAMTNEVQRNRAAQEIFGRGWTAMVPAIQKGSTAIKQMGEENAALGKGMTEGGIRAAEEYRQTLNDLKDVVEGATVAWGNRLIPTFTKWIALLTPSSQTTRYYIDDMGLLRDRVDEAAAAYAKLDGEQRRFLASSENAPKHAKPTPKSAFSLTPEEIEEQRKLADLQQKNAAESWAAQQAVIAEAQEFGRKYLETKQKTEEDAAAKLGDIQQKNAAESIAAQQAVLDEAKALGAQFLRDRQKDEDELQQRITDDDIKYWVKRIEDENALYEEQLKDLNTANDKASKEREAAWKQSFGNVRGIAEDAMAGLSSAVSTSIRGVILGTQTMEQAFKRMGESIGLSLVDSIVQRGLKQVENALLDFVFGSANGGGGGINWASLGSSAVSTVGSMAGGIASAAGSVASWLGWLDAGMWKVPGGTGSAAGYSGNWGKGAAGVAALHPGEMVVPPDIAELIRKAVAASGGSNFEGMYNLLTGGGGRGGTGPSSGSYGQMTAAERASLSSFGGFGNFGTLSTSFGVASGLLGMGPLGKTALDAMISGILGFDAVRGMLGVNPAVGFVSPTEAEYGSLVDTYGYGSRQEAEARTASAIGQSLVGDIDAARSGAAAAEAGAQESANRAAEAQEAAQRDAQGSGSTTDQGDTSGSRGSGPGDGSNDYAAGALFRTSGRTKMTVGEAGSETVAVLRNPREVMAGGGGAVTIQIINHGVIGDRMPEHLMRQVQRELKRKDQRLIPY